MKILVAIMVLGFILGVRIIYKVGQEMCYYRGCGR